MSKYKKLTLLVALCGGVAQTALASDRMLIDSQIKDPKTQKFCKNIIGSYNGSQDGHYHTVFDNSAYKDIPINKCLIDLETQNKPECFSAEINKSGAGSEWRSYADKSIKINLIFNYAVINNTKGITYSVINLKTGKTVEGYGPKYVAPGNNITFSIPIIYKDTPVINTGDPFHTLVNAAPLNVNDKYSLIITGLYYRKHPVSLKYDINPYIKDLKFHPQGIKCDGKFQCEGPLQVNPYITPYRRSFSDETHAFGYVDYFGYYGEVGVKVVSSPTKSNVSLEETDDLKNAGCGFTSSVSGKYMKYNDRNNHDNYGVEGGPQGPGFYGYNNMTFNFNFSGTINAVLTTYESHKTLKEQDLTYTLNGDNSNLDDKTFLLK